VAGRNLPAAVGPGDEHGLEATPRHLGIDDRDELVVAPALEQVRPADSPIADRPAARLEDDDIAVGIALTRLAYWSRTSSRST
jgi:hypothetical protein